MLLPFTSLYLHVAFLSPRFYSPSAGITYVPTLTRIETLADAAADVADGVADDVADDVAGQHHPSYLLDDRVHSLRAYRPRPSRG